MFPPPKLGDHAGSLAVADQDLVASCADLRTIGLQASQHSHGVLICGLAELPDCGRAGGTLLRRSLLLRQGRHAAPTRATVKSNFCNISGFLDQLSELLAGIEHAGLHGGDRDVEDRRASSTDFS